LSAYSSRMLLFRMGVHDTTCQRMEIFVASYGAQADGGTEHRDDSNEERSLSLLR